QDAVDLRRHSTIRPVLLKSYETSSSGYDSGPANREAAAGGELIGASRRIELQQTAVAVILKAEIKISWVAQVTRKREITKGVVGAIIGSSAGNDLAVGLDGNGKRAVIAPEKS